MVIYKVTNLVNGKIYIGKTVRTVEERKKQHIYVAIHNNSNFIFHKALRKYGENSFTWEVIDTAETENDLKEKEIFWITHYNSYIQNKNSNGYNMSLGGEGQSGLKWSEESKRKLSESIKLSGRTKGSKNSNTKLTEEDVLQIKELIKEGFSLTEISKKHNVSHAAISRIKTGDNWYYIGDDVSYFEYHGNAKLTESKVIEIKLLIKEGKMNQKDIAEKFNISNTTVNKISTGEIWKNVGEDVSHRENRRLTEHDVMEIKFLIKEGKLTLTEIAKRFNAVQASISLIKSGKTWKNVGEDVSNFKTPKRISKLTEKLVKEIKLLLKENNLTQGKIAEIYNVSKKTINEINTGKKWGHVIIV